MLNVLKINLNTVNKSLSMLKTFVNWAVDEKLIKENPFNNIKITNGKPKPEYLSIFELKLLVELFI